MFDNAIHYYAKLGRVAVTADMLNGFLDCNCCSRKRGCVHKAVCKWFFYENEMLNKFLDNNELEISTKKDFSNALDKSEEEAKSTQFYPPKKHEIIKMMCNYLLNHKKIPLSFQSRKINKISKLIPKETICYFCDSPLTSPQLITERGSILQIDCLTKNVTTYFKKCSNCEVCYRYQEHEYGIHNFNDISFISIKVCHLLRDCLLQHIPIGSVVKVLEMKLRCSLNSQTILNAYLHFDAMSNHSYDFNCVLCGYFPQILIMDLNRKIAFRCPAEKLQLSENEIENAKDVVNVNDFWKNVKRCMVLRGFPGRHVKEFDIQPSLLNWAPFIGKNTRNGDEVYNTEIRKIQPHSQALESNCRDVTEERILELLSKNGAKEVAELYKKLGGSGTGSKLDLIMKIKNIINNDEAKFKKVFSKIWGYSGGWASATCPHGIVYALKFVLRAESHRDYVDLLLSMQHQPTVSVIDMAHLVVAHGNKKKPKMFHPNNGMIAEPTEENIKKAASSNLSVSFLFLKEPHLNVTHCANSHPINGSSVRMCLFDRFHEKNTKESKEILRRVTHVEKLSGFLNTQRDEQLHSACRYDSRFYNNMLPVNHIFLFRSIMDFRNESQNKLKVSNVTALAKQPLYRDAYGRLLLTKENIAEETKSNSL